MQCITHLTQDPDSGVSDVVLSPVLSSTKELITESIRFFFNEQIFILIFLDRTQLQLLPLLPYNLLSVGMKMSNNSQVLMKQLSSVAWPLMDLDYPSTRPRILLSYNMDVWNRREEEEFPAMVQHTMRKVFCDLLSDFQTLLSDRGHFLHQCSLLNDVFNLKILLLLFDEDTLNCREESSGDNRAMVSAKMRHKEVLSLILSNLIRRREHLMPGILFTQGIVWARPCSTWLQYRAQKWRNKRHKF